MRVLFMGTPEFAVPCLDMLIKENYNVVGVVTQPDKPKGRGKKLAAPPIKEYAIERGIAVHQPSTLKEEVFGQSLKEIGPDLIIVTAYGKILPKYILEYPQYGCINVHASLLPKYRGAGPIQWCIINGEQETGITTMYMDEGIDNGDMILKKIVSIGKDETAGTLHDRLSLLGAEALKETIIQLQNNTITRIKQPHDEATYAPMLDKTIAKIAWDKSALDIKNLVRGVDPWPGAYTYYKGEVIKVWKVDTVEFRSDAVPGTILDFVENKGLVVKTGVNLCVAIQEVQFQGGRRMNIDEYLRGHSIEYGEILG